MKALHLHIDRIVVEGLSESGQRRFARVFEAQLHALAESGIADTSPAIHASGCRRWKLGNCARSDTRASGAQVVRSIRQMRFRQGASGQVRCGLPLRLKRLIKTGGGEARTHA